MPVIGDWKKSAKLSVSLAILFSFQLLAGHMQTAFITVVVFDNVAHLAEFEFNQNKLAKITSLARGVVRSIEVDLGSRVRAGQVLATLNAPEFTRAQAMSSTRSRQSACSRAVGGSPARAAASNSSLIFVASALR